MRIAVILFMSFFMVVFGMAHEVADSFGYPVDNVNEWVVAQDHQDCRADAVPRGITPCRHLGEDWNHWDGSDYINSGESVNAVANGYIVVSGVRKGFAGYVIMKHYLSDSPQDYVLSVYGHLQTTGLPKKNSYIAKGDLIAHIASKREMEKWTTFGPHLHFEIRKPKSITGYSDSYLNDGYFRDIKKYYYDPTDVTTLNWETGDWLEVDENNEKGFIESRQDNTKKISRARALQLIFDRFNITAYNTDFNTYLFGDSIQPPSDVNRQTEYYSYIVTAYNKGVAGGSNGMFKPNTNATLAEFLIMIDRAIPIPLDNPDYKEYPYSNGEWFASYVRAAYNAGILENRRYAFDESVSETLANEILDRAYEYFLGARSGISIYAQWTQKYADIDLYLLNDSVAIEEDDKHRVSNMQSLRDSNDLVYWNKHTSTWGAALDYDSWGANGNQPWAGSGEERITVDSQMVKRPGRYDIVMCYYDNWNNASMPDNATVSWWGINRGNNINTGGSKFTNTVPKGECLHVGYLFTR